MGARVAVEVDAEPGLEVGLSEDGVDHTHHGAALAVGDGVEDLVHGLGPADRYLYGVAAPQGVEAQGLLLIIADEGMGALYKGFAANALRTVGAAMVLVLYDTSKKALGLK